MYEDRDGTIWFGTDSGAERYDDYNLESYPIDDGLTDQRVRAIVQTDNGEMWFGSFRGGISRFDGDRWQVYTKDDGLPSNHCIALLASRGGPIWAAFWIERSRLWMSR